MEIEQQTYEDRREVNVREKQTYAIIDGLNAAFSRGDGVARLSDLMAISNRVKEEYCKYEIIADASARHRIDNRGEFVHLVKIGKIVMGPAGIDGDELIWKRAKSLEEKGYEVSIISNDKFPARRSITENVPISSVVFSFFSEEDIYFFKRNPNKKIKPEKPIVTVESQFSIL